MKLIYIAGKYRGKTINEIHDNIEAARKVAVKWWSYGFAVICPHLNSAMMDGAADDQIFIDGGIEILSRCDTIVMMKGWEESLGACDELELAHELDKQVVYE